ncbi:MAG: hypothetical protein QCI38_03255 [Candidatus Thermoplasmatota archaeon]|nr:hypothetical protein [Candidatus Thermoplasmatota archaeon]
MGFEIEVLNGYTGQIVRMKANAEETVSGLVDRLGAMWSLPPVPHCIVHNGKFVLEGTLMQARIGSGDSVEVVPDPFKP